MAHDERLDVFEGPDVTEIRDTLGTARPLTCPRCQRPLSFTRARIAGVVGTPWVYRCEHCQRGVAVIGLRTD